MSLSLSLEPWLRNRRVKMVVDQIPKGSILVDVGCGTTPQLIEIIKDKVRQCIGIDTTVKPKTSGKVTLIKQRIGKTLKLKSNCADRVTLLAVLEHLDYPEVILSECHRILKKDGKILLTVPSPESALLLKFLAKLHLVDPVMIDQHKHYFTTHHLRQILTEAGFKQIHIHLFEWGFNTHARAIKK